MRLTQHQLCIIKPLRGLTAVCEACQTDLDCCDAQGPDVGGLAVAFL